jgi:hypothetical protein
LISLLADSQESRETRIVSPADLTFFALHRGASNYIDCRPGKIHRPDIIPRGRQPIVHRDLGNEQSEPPREVLVFVSE